MAENRLRSETVPNPARSARVGSSNLTPWNANGRTYPEVTAALEDFDERLGLNVRLDATAEEIANRTMTSTLFAGLLLTRRRLLSGRSRHADLLALLPTLTGALQRSLRALRASGVHPGVMGDDAEDLDALVERFTGKAKGVSDDAEENASEGSTPGTE